MEPGEKWACFCTGAACAMLPGRRGAAKEASRSAGEVSGRGGEWERQWESQPGKATVLWVGSCLCSGLIPAGAQGPYLAPGWSRVGHARPVLAPIASSSKNFAAGPLVCYWGHWGLGLILLQVREALESYMRGQAAAHEETALEGL